MCLDRLEVADGAVPDRLCLCIPPRRASPSPSLPPWPAYHYSSHTRKALSCPSLSPCLERLTVFLYLYNLGIHMSTHASNFPSFYFFTPSGSSWSCYSHQHLLPIPMEQELGQWPHLGFLVFCYTTCGDILMTCGGAR